MDRVVREFNNEEHFVFLAGLFLFLRGLDKMQRDYFKSLGLDPKRTSYITSLNQSMQQRINQFAKMQPLSLELKQYFTSAIAQQKTTSLLIRGLKEQFGTLEKSGKLERYYDTYMWDAFMQFERAQANFYARQLKLNYFIYEGGLIETSRDFCIKRNGKLFHRKDAKKWKDDPTLPDPLTKDMYNPLIDLGRWNCRHWLRWITDKQAKEVKNAS